MTKYIFVLLLTTLISPYATSSEKSPFKSIELKHMITAEDVEIGGTLTLPEMRKTSPLVIMLSGSGPQDRDETLDGFKVFKELADHLGNRGIATFRFDDRGVGESSGNFPSSTLEDHSNDVRSIMDYFKNHRTNRYQDFILLGHSQGGIVSAHVAVGNPDVKKVVLMGAPSVPLIEVVTYQLREEYEGTDMDIHLIEAEVSAHNRLMNTINNNKNIDEALQQFKDATKSILAARDNKKGPAEIDSLAEAKTKEFEIIYALPSLTSFLYHDTAKDYEQLNVPVLGLFGGKDLQVTITQNKDRMENALLESNASYQFATFNDANHYFQKALTGSKDEYPTLEKRFVEGFVETISNWLLESK